MTLAVPETASPTTPRIPSVVVLGADALLAALPASPVQLAHACLLAGFQSVVPASWGDELIAAATLRGLDQHGHAPAVQCSCPFVAHRLLASGTDLRPFLVSLSSPATALARYLRAAHAPSKLRITYVGRCPGAADEAIDARLTPEELLANLADRQVVLEDQPRVFDSVIPPDRRRFYSQPGGLPTPEALWTDGGGRSLVEIDGSDLPVELTQLLLSGKPVLIDVASRLGCVCSGATPDGDPRDARARVVALEPPRAQSPVVDERIPVDLDVRLPASPRSPIDVVAPPYGSSSGSPIPAPMGDVPSSTSRREDQQDVPRVIVPHITSFAVADTTTPPSTVRRTSPPRINSRPVLGGMPTARDGVGRQLPRAYVARRRSPARPARGEVLHTPPAADTEQPVLGEGGAPDVGAAVTETRDGMAAVPLSPSSVAHRATATEASGPSAASVGRRPMEGRAPHTALSEDHLEDHLMEARTAARAPDEHTVAARVSDAPPEVHRFRERPVELPVTPLSDTPSRERPPTTLGQIAQRSVRQLLVFAILVSTIVLVSAAVGVLVGRWMAQP